MKKIYLLLIMFGLFLLAGCGGEEDIINTEFQVQFVDYNGNELKTEMVKYGESATAPVEVPDATIDGKKLTFNKWDKDFDLINRNLIVQALYNEEVIKITYRFYDHDDEVILEGETKHHGTIIVPRIREEIYIDGNRYVFDAWDKDIEKLEEDSDIRPIYIKANDEPQLTTHRVIYLDYDGYLYQEFTVMTGDPLPFIGELSDFETVSTIYTFSGWEEVPEIVNSDLVINPIYTNELKTFTVKFYGKTEELISEQSVKYGESAQLPEYEENNFFSWSIDSGYVTNDLNIYPIFVTDNPYVKVDFYADGYLLKSEYIEKWGVATPPIVPIKVGYTFSGWNSSLNFISSNKDITAVYVKKMYQLRVYDDQGTVQNQTDLEYLSEIDVEDPSELQGYTFIGWDYNNDGYPDALPKHINSDLDLKPIYIENLDTEYTVKHYYQNITGDGYTVNDEDTIVYNGRTNGYAIATPKLVTGFKYIKNHSSQIKSGDIKADGSLVLKLYYDREQYSVVFIDGKDEYEQLVRYQAAAFAPELTKEGYTLSWDIDYDNITSKKQVNAIWSINQYKITYQTDLSDKPEDSILDYQATITLPQLQYDNYSFKGWYLDPSFNTPFTDENMPAKDISLYGKWIDYDLTLTYNPSKKAIRAEGDILAVDFGAEARDTDGDTFEVFTKIFLGKQEVGASIVIEISAEGKYGVKRSGKIENVMVYGTPSLTYDETITTLNDSDEITAELLAIVATDTQNNAITDIDITVNGEFVAGETITLTITATDIANNKISKTTAPIKVYGKPTLVGQDISVKDSDPIDIDALAAAAKDSFDKELDVEVSKVAYKITYYRSKGGSIWQTDTVDHYSQASRPSSTPTSPSGSYYQFSGWYYLNDAGIETPFDFDMLIDRDYEVYALYLYKANVNILKYLSLFDYSTYHYANQVHGATFYLPAHVSGGHNLNIKARAGDPAYTSIKVSVYDESNNALVASTTYSSPDLNLNFNVTQNKMYRITVETRFGIAGTRGYVLTVSAINYNQGGKTSPQKLYALTATDDYGNTNTIYQNVKVYSKPTINISGSFDFKVEDEINLESFNVMAMDSFDNIIEGSSLTFEKLSGVQNPGEIVQYIITATDIVGNVTEKVIECKIYGKPIITINDKRDIKTTDIINNTLFSASAKDSFNKAISVTTAIYSGTKAGGEVISIKFTTTDHLGQTTETIIDNVKVYAAEDLYLAIIPTDSEGNIITHARIDGNAEEFRPMASGSFGAEGLTFSIEAADGSPLINGQTTDIVVVVTDAANNRKVSDVIKNITVIN